MRMLGRRDLSSAELETLPKSRDPATVIAANGEVQTNEEGTVYVHDLELFVTVQIFDDTPAVPVVWQALRRIRLCLRVGQWSKATAHQGWENNTVQYGKLGAHCCPRVLNNFLKLERQVQQYNEVTTATLWYREMEAIQQKPETKTRTTVKHRVIECETSQIGWRSSQKISKMQKCQRKGTHPQTLLSFR